jgi:cobalt-zinc-cadmium efflux system membrane fusion protein
VRGSPVQYFSLTLELERTDPALMKPGQRVRADLVMDGTDRALILPREAVFEKDGRKVAYRRSGSSFEPVEITLGPTALGRVVVEKGLEEGDTVALRDPTRPAEEEERDEEGETAGAPSGPQAGGMR